MTRNQLRHLLTIAERDGVTAALAIADEAECDALVADQFDRDAYGVDRDAPTQDDRCDSRGVPYLPRVNDAGEPWWM